MKNNDKHVIHGIDTKGFNFGVKKHLLRRVATAEEIKSFMNLKNQKDVDYSRKKHY